MTDYGKQQLNAHNAAADFREAFGLTPEYRQDDVLGTGYCPRCYRAITLDTSLHGHCAEHGKVPADFARPTGWTDPDDTGVRFVEREWTTKHLDGTTTTGTYLTAIGSDEADGD